MDNSVDRKEHGVCSNVMVIFGVVRQEICLI